VVALLLVVAVPNVRQASAAAPSTHCPASALSIQPEYSYDGLYLDPSGGVAGNLTDLQFGQSDPAVERLVKENASRLFEAFVALHARGYAAADLTGPLVDAYLSKPHRLGPNAATGEDVPSVVELGWRPRVLVRRPPESRARV
jgi:hypothetical protein